MSEIAIKMKVSILLLGKKSIPANKTNKYII